MRNTLDLKADRILTSLNSSEQEGDMNVRTNKEICKRESENLNERLLPCASYPIYKKKYANYECEFYHFDFMECVTLF